VAISNRPLRIVLGVLVLVGLVWTLAPITDRLLWDTIVPLIRGPVPADIYNKSLGRREIYVGGVTEENGILKLAITRLSLQEKFHDTPQAQMELVQHITDTLVKRNIGASGHVAKIRYRIYVDPHVSGSGSYWNVDTHTLVATQVQGDSDGPVVLR